MGSNRIAMRSSSEAVWVTSGARPMGYAESEAPRTEGGAMTMEDHDADRLLLLDRIAERVPELDLDDERVEWTTLDDGHEALLVNGGGVDGGNGAFFANCGPDVHVVG